MNDDAFYGENSGVHYAQARYLLYYLQEQGLLVPFYHRMMAEHGEDPTGLRTLQQILQRSDLERFQKEWESYVLALVQGE